MALKETRIDLTRIPLADLLGNRTGNLPGSSIQEIGSGFHATGYEIGFLHFQSRLFLRKINPVGFGHDLPERRVEVMLQAARPYPHSPETYAVIGVTQDQQIIDMTGITEVYSLQAFLPPDAVCFCQILRTPADTHSEIAALSDKIKPQALKMAKAMADIHSESFSGSHEEADSLYKRSMRAVIHDDELTAGVMDLIDFKETSWITPLEAVNFLGQMERAKQVLGTHLNRVTRIQGDFWANNIYFTPDADIIVTDSRLVWGEPAIDAGWMIGEFLMQDLVRSGHFGEQFTQIAQETVNHYIQLRNDPEILNFIGLPYAFQAFAEAFFTPNITNEQRRLLFATAYGNLQNTIKGEPFDFDNLNTYTAQGLELLNLLTTK